jgi:hypothetical protein
VGGELDNLGGRDEQRLSPNGIVEGSVVWTLAPGKYTAKGVRRFRGGARGAGGMRLLSAFPATSLSRMVTGAKLGRTCTSFKTSEPSLSTFSLGSSGFRHPLSGGSRGEGSGERKKRERLGTESLGSQRTEEVATSGGFKRPRAMAKRGREGPENSTLMTGAKGPSVVKREESLVEGVRSPLENSAIAMAVLEGNLKRDNPLLSAFKKYEMEGKPLEVVVYVSHPFDGDKIFLRSKGSGLTERLVDSQH